MADDVVSSLVRVLSVCRVAPVPSSPERGRQVKVKLSILDALWVATPPVQQVFLYELAAADEFAAVVERLKASLAAALALYLPLAGKLSYVAETGEVLIDCSDDAGVAFVEAEAGMDVRRLAGDAAHDVPALCSLVPRDHDVGVLPAPVMSVQATRLGGGGLAIGMSVHHAVADGRAMGLFKAAWTSLARGCSPAADPLVGLPVCDREAVFRPRDNVLAREVLRKVAPNLPRANNLNDYFTQRTRLAGKTFSFGANSIRSLKQHINVLASGTNASAVETTTKRVSTFVALAALAWTALARAKGLAAGGEAYLTFQVDLRARLHQHPVPDRYFGNCVRGCLASAGAGELLGEAGLLRASRAIQAAVAEVEAAPLLGTATWMERLTRLPRGRVACLAGSPLFRVHEAADFGFGLPARVAPVDMAGSPVLLSSHEPVDFGLGRVVLTAGKAHGDVHMSVSVDPVLMDGFTAHVNCTARSKI